MLCIVVTPTRGYCSSSPICKQLTAIRKFLLANDDKKIKKKKISTPGAY